MFIGVILAGLRLSFLSIGHNERWHDASGADLSRIDNLLHKR
jgi:hypothetical protein